MRMSQWRPGLDQQYAHALLILKLLHDEPIPVLGSWGQQLFPNHCGAHGRCWSCSSTLASKIGYYPAGCLQVCDVVHAVAAHVPCWKAAQRALALPAVSANKPVDDGKADADMPEPPQAALEPEPSNLYVEETFPTGPKGRMETLAVEGGSQPEDEVQQKLR